MSARTSPRAWDLRCEVREKMIAWLQENHSQALPRIRAEVAGEHDEALPREGQMSEPDRLRQPRDIHE